MLFRSCGNFKLYAIIEYSITYYCIFLASYYFALGVRFNVALGKKRPVKLWVITYKQKRVVTCIENGRKREVLLNQG